MGLPMSAYSVSLNHKHIDTVYYVSGTTCKEVKESLINHDGYDPNINVRRQRLSKSSVHDPSGLPEVFKKKS